MQGEVSGHSFSTHDLSVYESNRSCVRPPFLSLGVAHVHTYLDKDPCVYHDHLTIYALTVQQEYRREVRLRRFRHVQRG